jgi:hypothetical protein
MSDRSQSFSLIPKLETLEKGKIVKFYKETDEYDRDVEAMNRNKSGAQRINKRTLMDCISEDLLRVIKKSPVFQSIEAEDENEQIDRFLKYILSKDDFETKKLSLVLELKKVFLKQKIENAMARMLVFQADLTTLLKENGFEPEEVLGDESRFGNLVTMMLDNEKTFNPPEIRAWVKFVLTGKRGKIAYDELAQQIEQKLEAIYAVNIMEKLVKPYKFDKAEDTSPHTKQNNRPLNESANRDKKEKSPAQPDKSKRDHDNNQDVNRNAKRPKIESSVRGSSPNKHEKKNSCWGCGDENHSLKNCTIITDEAERFRIVEAKKASSKKNTDSFKQYIDFHCCMAQSHHSHNDDATTNNSLVVFLNQAETKVLLDNGSDRSLISMEWIKDYNKFNNIPLQVIKLSQPKNILLADASTTMETTGYVELDISFKLYDNLRMKKCQFFVVQEKLELPIIGLSELAEIGLDPKSTIDRLSFGLLQNESEKDEYISQDDDDSNCTLDFLIQQMLLRAKKAGMPEPEWKLLCKLVNKYKDVFRDELSEDPAANVTPMDVFIKTGMENVSWNSYNIKYTQEELAWLKDHISKLEENGFIYRNPHARYASPALVVPKPGRPGEFRLCVDVKKPNSLVASTHWPMPHMDVLLRKLGKSTAYAKLDAFKGYWLFPVTPRCGELYSIKTPFGVFTPKRIVQGAQEAVRYFQAGMEEALNINDRDDLLLWVDDILAHATTPRELLSSLEHIFRCCRDRNICLSARKCDLYLKEVTWCGRTISSRGIGFDPEYIQGIENLEIPKTVGDLQQFICSMNWVRSTIPHYNMHMHPLTECLQNIEATIGSNKKKILGKRNLSDYTEWDEDKLAAFVKAKDLLKSSVISTHYDPTQRLCVFPDASDDHWGLFITQVPKEDLKLSFEEQRHSPVLIMSGTFKNSSKK